MLETESIWYKREIKAKKDLLYSPELDRAGNTRNTFVPLLPPFLRDKFQVFICSIQGQFSVETVLRVLSSMNAGRGLISELSDHRVHWILCDDFTKYFV